MRSVIRQIGLSMLLAATVVAGGCSDDNNDNPANPTPTPTPTPAPQPTPTPEATPTPSPEGVGSEISFLGKLQRVVPEDKKLVLSGGWDVVVQANTIITRDDQPVTFESLQVGEVLRVKGTVEPMDVVMAKRITVDPYNDN